MKRHEGIQVLSRDHHTGLLFGWKIKQGIARQVSPGKMQPYVKYFWNNHLKSHFEEEETLLFPLLKSDIVKQAITEHKQIRQLAEEIIGAVTPGLPPLQTLADMLEQHIRFEERVVFPLMEKELPEKELAAIGNRLQQLHPIQETDNYPNDFWK